MFFSNFFLQVLSVAFSHLIFYSFSPPVFLELPISSSFGFSHLKKTSEEFATFF